MTAVAAVDARVRAGDEPGLDPLTGAWNHAGFLAAGEPLFDSCRRRGTPVAVALFDFAVAAAPRAAAGRAEDDATLGRVLATMAAQLRRSFRTSDVVGRTGPLRLAVLLTDCTGDVVATLEGVRTLSDRATSGLGLSLGVSMTRAETDTDLAALLCRADERAADVRGADERAARSRRRAAARAGLARRSRARVAAR